jgi:hypothetical protein
VSERKAYSISTTIEYDVSILVSAMLNMIYYLRYVWNIIQRKFSAVNILKIWVTRNVLVVLLHEFIVVLNTFHSYD